MSYEAHKEKSPTRVSCAVLTISGSRTEQDDDSGKIIKGRLSKKGHQVVAYSVLKDDAELIKKKIFELLVQPELQVIITNGGTGISHRDITVDTISQILEKKLEGFGELFRLLTYQELGTASIMSRAMAGVVGGKVIICLPGSPDAASLAMDKIILPEIGHLVREVTR